MRKDKKSQIKKQRALVAFGELALRANDLDVILQESCRLVAEALGTDLAKVMELQPDGTTLILRAGVGWGAGILGQLTVKAEITSSEGYALVTGQSAASSNVRKERRFSFPKFLIDEGVKAIVNVVIIGHDKDRAYGTLQVDSRRERTFKDDEIVFLQGYANLIGAAVDRLREAKEATDTFQHMSYMAYHDALTGLPNRAMFFQTLEGLFESKDSRQFAIMFLDLDGFKQVNDRYGHTLGDALLVQVADRISQSVRASDLVARLGGDEFAVIQVRAMHRDSAAELARRILKAVSDPYLLNGQRILLNASVGISFGGLSHTPHEGLSQADRALYSVKGQGKAAYKFYDHTLDDKVTEEQKVREGLQHALAHKQFELLYQPIIQTDNNRIACFEALLRWNHPDYGSIPPAEFISVAESSGLIVPIGKWVLQVACEEAAQWRDDTRIAVNLSPRQLNEATLVEDVSNILVASGLPANRLELEITETFVLQHNTSTIEIIKELKRLGVHIALDDFGTGYSSLSHLRQMPFDNIKLDRSFVSDLPDHNGAEVIAQVVSHLGRSFNATTTAEGVETDDQLAIIKREGYTYAQGYLVGRPASASSVLEITRKFS